MGNAGDKILYTSESLADAARRLQQVGAALQRETGGLLSTLGQLDRGNGGDCRIQGRLHLTTVGASYSAGTVEGFIREISKALNAEGDYAKNLAGRVKKVSEAFERAEKDLVGQVNGIFTGDDPFGGNGGGAEDSAWQSLIKQFMSLVGANGTIGTAGTVLGLDWSAALSGSLLSGSFDTHGKAEWNLEKGDAFAGVGFDLSGHVAQGEASGQIGLLSGKAKISAITGGIVGDVGVSLMKDGEFVPSIQAKLKAEVSALTGEANVTLGNDQINAHADASGKLLTANAKAEVGAGRITYENADGKTVTEWGAQAQVGAEAYIATGKVSGGITIFGIDIDVGVEGHAGGAGVSAGGQITTSGASGKIGAGLGIGGGVEISVDWSDFKLPSLSDFNWFG